MIFFQLRASLIAGAVFCCGLIGTYYLAEEVRRQLQIESYTKLEAVGGQVANRLQESVEMATNDLRALQAFFAASEFVSVSEFKRYVNVALDNHRGHIQALSWAPLIRHSERGKFEAELRLTYPDFRITARNDSGQLVNSGEKTHYVSVAYLEPYEINRPAHGFDLNSNATRRESLVFSRDSGDVSATAKIRLVQEKGESSGFLMIAPVYSDDMPLNDAGQRERALRGYVTGVFRVDSLMQNSQSQALQEGMILSLLDHNSKGSDLLYGQAVDQSILTFNLDVPQRHWQLHIALSESLNRRINYPPLVTWIMIGGVAVSFLLAVCFYALMHSSRTARRVKELNQQALLHNTELEATVAERTEALAQQNEELKNHVSEMKTKRKILVSLMEDGQKAKGKAEERAIELTRSNNDLDDFAYVASHDLKSPLRGIDQLASWVIEDLEAGKLDEIPENLNTMRQRVHRMETLLNDLLAYSRAGRQESKITTVNSRAVFEDMFVFNHPSGEFDLTIEGDFPELQTVVVPFEQVVGNLLGNAIKHHNRKNGHLEISCREEGDYYCFAVQDDGPGIDPDYHDQVFKMFKTLKPRDEVEGSGMGLALIKKIVEHYGGRVYLESALGKGTTFFFTWPKVM